MGEIGLRDVQNLRLEFNDAALEQLNTFEIVKAVQDIIKVGYLFSAVKTRETNIDRFFS